jgi:hypothetical protein
MNRSRILLVGDLPELEGELRKAGYDVILDTNPGSAGERLRKEWFHLAIVQLRSAGDAVDAERLALVMQTNGLVPKIILSQQALDQMSQMVCEALTSLKYPAPAVAFISQIEGLEVVVDFVGKAIERYVGINRRLQILPGYDVFYTLAGWIMPGTDPGLWVSELGDLFRILFQGCTHIEVAFRENLRGRRGELATVWVQPKSEVIPQEHPLLVKCGPRENIEKARESYERYFFRVTASRLAGFARTSHFAAIALPAPTDRPDMVYDFPTFYRNRAEADIHKAIDCLFGQACKPWYRQSGAPLSLQGKGLRSFYLDRLGLKERGEAGRSIHELIETAPSYGLWVEQPGTEISFRFRPRERPDFYPHPLLHLYSGKKSFELTPSQVRITHGDLRDTNLCVDADGVVWLDGYESMDWGPAVTDVTGLEAILKFRCMESLNWYELYQFERTVLSPTRFDEPLKTQGHSREIQQILSVIDHLRKEWAKRLSSTDMQEYYASLFFFTMRELVSEETAVGLRPPEVHRLHALLSAAMICFRLEHWNNWTGWPGPKQVLPLRGKT